MLGKYLHASRLLLVVCLSIRTLRRVERETSDVDDLDLPVLVSHYAAKHTNTLALKRHRAFS